MASSEQSGHLRHIVAPYIGQIVILALVTLGVLYVGVTMHEWKILLTIPVMWLLLFSFPVYAGLKYKIFWTDEAISQQASGGKSIHIRYDEITKIASETSNPSELLAASRPFRRIVIYAGKPHGNQRFIDVSLKHFAADDIRKLMCTIQSRRPDLTLPPRWM